MAVGEIRLMPNRNRIKEYRDRKGMSQEDLASLVGTSSQQISRLEKGERRLSDAWLPKLAKALEVRQSALLVEEGPESAAPSEGDFAKDDIERRLLKFWRTLGDDAKDVVITAVSAWADRITRRHDGGH